MNDEHDSESGAVFDDWQPLTDAEVRAGARPGESWSQARRRLEGLSKAETAAGLSQWWHDRRPEYLQPRASLPRGLRDPAQLAAQLADWQAYHRLSSRERFNLRNPGVRWPTYDELLASPLADAPRDWVACAERLPQTHNTALRYLVHTAHDQRVTLVRYAGNGMWSRVSDGTFISRARHWRVALEHEQAQGERSATRDECYLLARLSRLHGRCPFA
jgi:hypothetical protein